MNCSRLSFSQLLFLVLFLLSLDLLSLPAASPIPGWPGLLSVRKRPQASLPLAVAEASTQAVPAAPAQLRTTPSTVSGAPDVPRPSETTPKKHGLVCKVKSCFVSYFSHKGQETRGSGNGATTAAIIPDEAERQRLQNIANANAHNERTAAHNQAIVHMEFLGPVAMVYEVEEQNTHIVRTTVHKQIRLFYKDGTKRVFTLTLRGGHWPSGEELKKRANRIVLDEGLGFLVFQGNGQVVYYPAQCFEPGCPIPEQQQASATPGFVVQPGSSASATHESVSTNLVQSIVASSSTNRGLHMTHYGAETPPSRHQQYTAIHALVASSEHGHGAARYAHRAIT